MAESKKYALIDKLITGNPVKHRFIIQFGQQLRRDAHRYNILFGFLGNKIRHRNTTLLL